MLKPAQNYINIALRKNYKATFNDKFINGLKQYKQKKRRTTY